MQVLFHCTGVKLHGDGRVMDEFALRYTAGVIHVPNAAQNCFSCAMDLVVNHGFVASFETDCVVIPSYVSREAHR